MAIGGISPVELNGMVGRTQDFSQIKHQENNRPVVDQGNFQAQVEKNTENKSTVVQEGQKTDTDGENQGGSRGSYGGDGGKNRKRSEVPKEGRMIMKNQHGFDISI